MPRPQKCRRVCSLPGSCHFGPLDHGPGEVVTMTIDEYETIRLIDLEKLTQQQCSEQMQVSRATVQHIYDAAREKLADCLIHAKGLRIAGGEYQLCSGSHGCCYRRRGQGCRKSACANPPGVESPIVQD